MLNYATLQQLIVAAVLHNVKIIELIICSEKLPSGSIARKIRISFSNKGEHHVYQKDLGEEGLDQDDKRVFSRMITLTLARFDRQINQANFCVSHKDSENINF